MKRSLERIQCSPCYLKADTLPLDLLMLICRHLDPLDLQALCRALCALWQFDIASTTRRHTALLKCRDGARSLEKYTELATRLMGAHSGPPHSTLFEFICTPRCYYCAEALAVERVGLIESDEKATQSHLDLCSACTAKLWKNRMTQDEVSTGVARWKGPVYRMHVPYHRQIKFLVARLRGSIGHIDGHVLDGLIEDAGLQESHDTFARRYRIRRIRDAPPSSMKSSAKSHPYLLSDVKTALDRPVHTLRANHHAVTTHVI